MLGRKTIYRDEKQRFSVRFHHFFGVVFPSLHDNAQCIIPSGHVLHSDVFEVAVLGFDQATL